MAHKKRRTKKHFGALPLVFGLPLLPVLAGLAATGIAAFFVLKKKASGATSLNAGSSLVISPDISRQSALAQAARVDATVADAVTANANKYASGLTPIAQAMAARGMTFS